MSKFFGGNPEDYLEFATKTIDQDLQDVLAVYAKENSIDFAAKMKDNFEQKMQKLAFFFDKAAEDYRELVETHPNMHFHGLIKLLKEKGEAEYDGQNFKNMREKLRELKESKKEVRTEERK